jgi:lipoprotein NlpD
MTPRPTQTGFRSWRRRASAAGPIFTLLLLAGCSTGTPFTQPNSEPRACVSASAGYYCVQPGDSLNSVASSFGRRPDEIAQWNGLIASAALHTGQILRVGPPAGVANVSHATPPPEAMASRSRFVWPVSGTVVREFGAGGSRGIEIAGHAGTPIKAAEGGRVVYAGDTLKQYGLMVIVKHDDHFVTAYGNNSRLTVAEGATVQRGATIAEMGARSGGQPLLQFEMREDGRPVDPLAYLPPGSGPVMP